MNGSQQTRTRGRGILGLTDFKPVRRPGQAVSCGQPSSVAQPAHSVTTTQTSQGTSAGPSQPVSSAPAQRQMPATSTPKPAAAAPAAASQTRGKEGMAKYTYKANPNSPLGQEASLKQGEKILILQEHPVTAYANDWVNVHTISGSKGYVPKSYVHVPEGGLPWLANQKLASKPAPMEPEPKPTAVASKATPYQAAYSENRAKTTDQWYCDLCEKKFNGPQPLRSHMASRYHKDMVEELEDSKR